MFVSTSGDKGARDIAKAAVNLTIFYNHWEYDLWIILCGRILVYCSVASPPSPVRLVVDVEFMPLIRYM